MVTLYTTHCPKCCVLEKKLKQKSIDYTEVTDTSVMLERGFKETPMMEVDGVLMNFSGANQWINDQVREG